MFLAPSGYAPSKTGNMMVVKEDSQDLVIGATGLSRSALGSLVSSGLKSAA
jgi:hypothetical protein